MHIAFSAGPLEAGLQLQLSQALEKRTELVSRRAMPGLWRQTDRLRQQHTEKKTAPAQTVSAWVWLVLGVLITCFCLFDPQRLLALLAAGLFLIVYGAIRLVRSHPSQSRFDRAAKQLIETRRHPLAEETRISFDEQGITVESGKQRQTAAYSSFECVVEAPRLLLLVFDQQVMVLVKEGLLSGSVEELRTLLQQQGVEWGRTEE